jgi:hypothetical protein
LSASIIEVARLAHAFSADFAVGAVTATPKLKSASFGTVVTVPLPSTVIVRGLPAEAIGAAASVATDRRATTILVILGQSTPQRCPDVTLAAALYITLTRFRYRGGSPPFLILEVLCRAA